MPTSLLRLTILITSIRRLAIENPPLRVCLHHILVCDPDKEDEWNCPLNDTLRARRTLLDAAPAEGWNGVAFFDFSRNKGQRCLFDGLKWRLLSLFASSLMSKRSPRPACAQAAPFFMTNLI
jgi:hypothetical protein